MRFLVDAQLPPALARWFGEQGLSASPVRELGLRDSDDGSIMNHTISGDWTVVTKDEDFVARSLQHSSPPRIVWLRIGNCTNKVLIRWLGPLLPEILRQLESGHKLVEVRKSSFR